MWYIVKRGTHITIGDGFELLTRAILEMEILADDLSRAFPGKISSDDFDTAIISDDEIEALQWKMGSSDRNAQNSETGNSVLYKKRGINETK